MLESAFLVGGSVMKALVAILALLVFSASAQPVPTSVSQTFPLWPGDAPGMINPPKNEPPPNGRGSYVGVVHPTLVMSLAANSNGAAVLILSGGSYKKVVRADTDGRDVARWLNSLGIDAYVLKYRLPMETFNPPEAAYQDAQRALRLIRSNAFAGEFGHRTDPHRIGVIGFSAGGHLAGVMGTYYSTAFYPPVDDHDRVNARHDFYDPRQRANLFRSGPAASDQLLTYPSRGAALAPDHRAISVRHGRECADASGHHRPW